MEAITYAALVLLALFFLAVLLAACAPKVAASAVKVGVNAKVYRNTGTYGSPTWTAQNSVKDCTPAMPWDMQEAGARTTKAKLYAKTRADLGAQITMRADDAATDFNAFADAACSQTSALDLLILDGPISTEGARGWRAHMLVSLSGQPQEIDGVIYNQFDLKPTFSTEGVPSTVVMGASSTPTFTAL